LLNAKPVVGKNVSAHGNVSSNCLLINFDLFW